MAGRLIALCLLFGLASPLAAQMADPMRPPAGAGEGAAAAGEAGSRASPVQAVILRHGGQPAVLLDGQRLTIGSRYGDARVIAISETEVVLAGRSGRQVIRLNPDVSKKPAHEATAPPKKSKRRSHPSAQGESPQ